MDFNELMKSEDYTKEYDIQDINANKLMGILAYFWILFLVPIFTARQSRFAMFHVEQAITLFIGATVFGVITGIVCSIDAVAFILGPIFGLVSLVFLVLAVIGIINAANGQAKELPLVGKFKIVKLQ